MALEYKANCEKCTISLKMQSEACICSYECTFCAPCVEQILENVCPNCGGGFEKRPTRPNSQLGKYPMRNDNVFRPIEFNKFICRLNFIFFTI